MNYIETLTTKRLILRPITVYDFDEVHSWAGNPDNIRYMAYFLNITVIHEVVICSCVWLLKIWRFKSFWMPL